MELTKQKIYIAIAAIIIILILITVFLVVPLVRDTYSLADNLKQKKTELAAAEAKGNNLKKIKDDQEEVEVILKKLSQSLLARDNTLDFILPLEKIADKNNIKQTIDIVNKEPDEKDSKKKEGSSYVLEETSYLPVNINLRGEFKNIASYVLDLESIGIYTDVANITINAKKSTSSSNKPTASEEDESEDLLSASLQLRAFTSE
ncbi:MAG: hypothetical protein HQ530_04730 [Parcubacteria group bacterium]|nr:hypothetical protein [Parcubacteria group bacterium]